MFRREPRDPIERPLSQFRQHLEHASLDEEIAPDEELATPASPEATSPAYQRPSTLQQTTAVPRAPELATIDRAISVIAANARWEGTLQTDGSLVIHGQIKGTIRAAHDVTIAEGASVDAEIIAQNVAVHGTVQGRIEARGRLEIHPSGQVVGEVQAPSLVVHEGARLSGKLKMSAADEGDR